MYPLLLKPVIKDYLWGGTTLKTEYGFKTDKDIAAEGWLLSLHKDGINIVLNGEHKGKDIKEVLDIWGEKALGERAKAFTYFPLLIKFIDAKLSLSVQVHPDDDYALAVEGEYGKTEMWYVLDCKDGASLIYGFDKDISKEEFEKRIKENTLTEVCNYVPVKKGDVFFISAGTLHAIGEGILIAEVQQNSNTTYRVSDYGRLGADGKPRELHIDKALQVTRCEAPDKEYGNIGLVTKIGENTLRELACCDKFTVKLLDLKDSYTINEKETFVSVIVLDGNFKASWQDGQLELKKGDSLYIPSGMKIHLNGKAEVLYSYI